MGKEVIENRP